MNGGGSEQQTLLLARHLDRQRFAPQLWLQHRAGSLLDQVPADVPVHSFDCPAPAIYLPGRGHAAVVGSLCRLARAHPVDVVYDRTFNMTALAAAALDRRRTPRVSTMVSPPDRAVPLVEKRFIALKRRRLVHAYQNSHAVLAVSEQTADAATRYYGLHRSRIEVLPNPVDIVSLRQSAPPSETRRGIVCVGRLTAEKGHADLLAAYAKLPPPWRSDHPLRLVGDGPLHSDLRALSTRLGLESEVTFVGAVPNAAPEITAAGLLVLPSHFEGLPNVVLEAMALDTPVVATTAGGTGELSPDPLRPTMAMVAPGDPAALAKAMRQTLVDSKAAQSRVDAARKHLREHHDVDRAVRRIEQILESAVS